MGFLIAAAWVFGEAAELGIQVSAAEVTHRFDRLRREQFHRPAQFKAFLKRTGQTIEDLLFRVRLNMLTSRVQQQIIGHGSPRSQRRRLMRFVSQFKRKWTAQTSCESLYEVPACGHTASSL